MLERLGEQKVISGDDGVMGGGVFDVGMKRSAVEDEEAFFQGLDISPLVCVRLDIPGRRLGVLRSPSRMRSGWAVMCWGWRENLI